MKSKSTPTSWSFDDYTPGRFRALANTTLGRALWARLTDEKSRDAMEVASDLGHPAVAALEECLLNEFGEDVLDPEVKQMIGHMVRQIMEEDGFVIDQQNVKVNSVPFSKATRYRRPDWYRCYVFRSSKDPRELCFTDARNSEKLPPAPDSAEWRYWTAFATTLRGVIAFGISPKEVRAEVREKGYARRRHERIVRAR